MSKHTPGPCIWLFCMQIGLALAGMSMLMAFWPDIMKALPLSFRLGIVATHMCWFGAGIAAALATQPHGESGE